MGLIAKAALCLAFLSAAPTFQDEDLGAVAVAALTEAQTGEAFGAALNRVFELFQQRVDGHRYDDAIVLAEAMLEQSASRGEPYLRTRAWAALTLGLCCTRGGQHERADAVVSEHIELLRREVRRVHLQARDAREAGNDERAAELEGWKRGLRLSLRNLSLRLAASARRACRSCWRLAFLLW